MVNSSQDHLTPLLSEKAATTPPPAAHPPTAKVLWWLRISALLSLLLVLWVWHRDLDEDSTTGPQEPGDQQSASRIPKGWTEWGDITPSEKLVWEPCFEMFGGNHQCTRLVVPMDYHRPLNESDKHPKVEIAVVMLPGKTRTDSPTSYSKSPLLLNPGGPGGSGVTFILAGGEKLQKIVGEHHDLIGFDPRGVGATTPYANCFTRQNASDIPGDMLERNRALMNRMVWTVSGHDVGIVNSSDVALAKIDIRARAVAELCKKADHVNGNDSIYKYVNTPNVARDMLSIVDAWDDWRSTADVKQAKPIIETAAVRTSRGSQTKIAINTKDFKDTQGKLVYWGFSYGTLLGATFSAMFPDRVGRVILDGVVDADHYVEPIWIDSIQDTDRILDKFSTYCFEAKGLCSLYRDGDKTEKDVQSRFNEIMESIKKTPLIVILPQTTSPIILSWSDIKLVLFSSLYNPISMFPIVADFLDAIYRGDDLTGFVIPQDLPSVCNIRTLPVWPDDARDASMCSDKRYKLNATLPELEETFKQVANYSQFADVWMSLMIGCNGWKIESKDPPMRWDDHPISKYPPIKTNFPVLFVSSHFDPVTPLQAALKMTKKFVNSSIIEQDSEGHCSLACPSLCTTKKIRDYLDDGIVPEPPKFDDRLSSSGRLTGEWTTCGCEAKPWKSFLGKDGAGSTYQEIEMRAGKTEEELDILQALTDVGSMLNKYAWQKRVFQGHPLEPMFLAV